VIQDGNAIGAPDYVFPEIIDETEATLPQEQTLTEDSGAGIRVLGRTSAEPMWVADPTISRCVFRNNIAIRAGAALIRPGQQAPTNFVNCVFHDNEAENAAVFEIRSEDTRAPSATLNLSNCLIYDNVAEETGSVLVSGSHGNARLWNCTVVNNVCLDSDGSAFHHANQGGTGFNLGSVGVRNSIVWDNARGGTTIDLAAQFFGKRGVNYSCVSSYVNQSGETGNITSNPIFENPSIKNFRLWCESPCVDSGGASINMADDFADLDFDNNSNEDVPFDIEDPLTRVYNSVVDMGAYEDQPAVCPPDIDHDGVVDIDDYTAVNLSWGNCPSSPNPCPADFYPQPCGDGVVNIEEYTAISLYWDTNCEESQMMGGGGESSSQQQESGIDDLTPQEALFLLISQGVVPPDMIEALLAGGYLP